MHLEELFKSKETGAKQKVILISNWLLDGSLPLDELIAFADRAKDPVKASCIEAIELASQTRPALVDRPAFDFVTQALAAKAPRIKWESAKVIGNVAAVFSDNLDQAITALLVNTSHEGTVVRWSAAYALGEILKLGTDYNLSLLQQFDQIIEKEEKNSIKKIYQAALKKIKRS